MNMSPTELMNEEYDYEGLYDLSEDVEHAIDGEYSSKINKLPQDKHGYISGKFVVTITWYPEQEEKEE